MASAGSDTSGSRCLILHQRAGHSRLIIEQATRQRNEVMVTPNTGMTVDILTEVTIERPLAEVAAYAANPDHAPVWYANIKSVEWKTPRPAAVGSRIAFVAHFLGRRLAYTYEIVELMHPERMVMRTAEGPFPMETTYTWTATPEGLTGMTLRNRGTPSEPRSLMVRFMADAMRRANRKDLARLKALLERGNG